DNELDLPVNCLAWQHDIGEGGREASGELGEGRRAGWHLQAGLGGVVAVIGADREHLRRSWRRGAEVVDVDGRGAARRRIVRPFAKRLPLAVDGLGVRAEATIGRRRYVDAALVADQGESS